MKSARSLFKSALQTVLPEAAFQRLRLLKMRSDRKNFSPRSVSHNYGGHQLEVRLADRVGEDWYDHDWTEADEIKFLRDYSLKQGSKVFDIGAHQGIVAMMLSKEVGNQGKVIAIEANPFNAKIANVNVAQNRLGNLQIVNAAISDRAGTLEMNEDSNGQIDSTGALGKITVPARTVDSLTEEFGKPDLIFLDVEGFETHALKGATATLAQRPDLFIEVHVGTGLEKFGGSVRELFSLLPDGYRFFYSASGDSLSFREAEAGFILAEENGIVAKRFFLAAIRR